MSSIYMLGAFLLGLAAGSWITNWAWRDHERREAARRRLTEWVG